TLLSTNALVFVQENDDWPNASAPRIQCILAGTDHVTCTRGGNGSVVNFQVQVFEHRALTVQQASYNCGTATTYQTPTVPLAPAVSPGQTFVTSTVKVGSGQAFGGNDLVALRLIDANNLGLELECQADESVAVQVASMSGINVRRGNLLPFTGVSQS